MLVSVTRLRVRSLFYLVPFVLGSERVGRQARNSAGFLGGKLLIDRRLTFWTLTAWSNEASMRTFRSSGIHAAIMPKLARWCSEAAVTHWDRAGVELPSWEEASERLRSLGRRTPVDAPSADHRAGRIPKPRLIPAIERRLRPRTAPPRAAAARA